MMRETGFCIMLVFSTLVGAVTPTSGDGFCSNVYEMHQHCVSRGTTVPQIRQGKAGPRGATGEKGEPGIVDYDAIDRKISQEFSETMAEYRNRLAGCESAVQENRNTIEQLEQKLIPIAITDCTKVDRRDAKITGETGGVFDIYPRGIKMEVYCDLTTDDGGWIVFQRRMDGSVDFYRGWKDYVNGFGNKDGEFWLGLDSLHRITSSGKYELRVDLEDWSGNKRFAKYSTFKIGDASSYFRLTITGYSGTASDSISRENGRGFSTKDSDHDGSSSNCALDHKGAWWYGACHEANLNGLYHRNGSHSSYADGINWRHWKGYHYSMKFTEMKIRPSK